MKSRHGLNSNHWRRVTPAILLAVAAQLAAAQASQSKEASARTPDPASLHAQVLIAPGDLLSISIYDEPEEDQEVRVEEGGGANLSLLGPVKLSGMTAEQAGEFIARQLSARHFLLNPQVTVLIEDFATQGVSITGEVNHPGVYPVLGNRTLLDVISLAGGLTSMADTAVTIKHRSSPDDQVTVRVTVDDATAALNENVQVYPGDLIVVPRAGIVYVLGDVARPGGFVMQDDGKVTLLQALAQAGGANRTAAINGGLLLHKTASGYATDRIRVGDLLKGKLPDFAMNPNDILFIPGSRLRYFESDSQGIASAAVGAAVYHVVP